MSRRDNLLITYKITEKYNEKHGPIPCRALVKYIVQGTGVRERTAKDYIKTLCKGVVLNSKVRKIGMKGGKYITKEV